MVYCDKCGGGIWGSHVRSGAYRYHRGCAPIPQFAPRPKPPPKKKKFKVKKLTYPPVPDKILRSPKKGSKNWRKRKWKYRNKGISGSDRRMRRYLANKS